MPRRAKRRAWRPVNAGPCGDRSPLTFSTRLKHCLCLLWVISGHNDNSAPCPLCPQKRTLVGALDMSADIRGRPLGSTESQGSPPSSQLVFDVLHEPLGAGVFELSL